MKQYLLLNEGATILNEYEAAKNLKVSTRRKLVSHIANFIIRQYGYYPSTEQKVMVCKAVVNLFPAYHIENSQCDGIVSVKLQVMV